jgi:hypothetical protein
VSTGTKNSGEIEHPSHVKRREAAAELRWTVGPVGFAGHNAASEPQPDQATSKVWTARTDRAVLGIEKDGAYDQREI